MFIYDKKLQYPVKIDKPNPRLAAIIISQYGGPDGELGASMRYLSQRYSMPFDELKGLLTDIGTEGSKWHRHNHQSMGGKLCVLPFFVGWRKIAFPSHCGWRIIFMKIRKGGLPF